MNKNNVDSSHNFNPFLPFYSATYTRKYLTRQYKQSEIPQPKTNSYRTTYAFIYELQHGELYIKEAEKAPLQLKPVLLFYGLVKLIKSCVRTVDPHYPKTSAVLAHGVSTRKRKKTTYSFLHDEVRIQKNGLFRYFLNKMFHMEHPSGLKYRMDLLLYHIADMHILINHLFKKEISIKGKIIDNYLVFPDQLLDCYHMTLNRFTHYLHSYKNNLWTSVDNIIEKDRNIYISFDYYSPNFSHPFLFTHEKTPYILKNKEMNNDCSLPELGVHYLLLYNLSMISRYETEWWGELIHTFDGTDFPIISYYLTCAPHKIIHLIAHFLNEKIVKNKKEESE